MINSGTVAIDRDGIGACSGIAVSVVVTVVSVSDGSYDAIMAMVLGFCRFSEPNSPGFLVILPVTQYAF